MGRIGRTAIAAAAAMSLAGAAEAALYVIEWTGGGGYAMEGLLLFDDGLLNTGVIDETQIQNLAFTVYLNGVSQGQHDVANEGLGSYAADFNLNFDTTAGRFVVGGDPLGSEGQNWYTSATAGALCDPVGFSSGLTAQGVCVGGAFVPDSFIEITSVENSSLRAFRFTELTPVPLPAALPLLGLGVAALWGLRRRRA